MVQMCFKTRTQQNGDCRVVRGCGLLAMTSLLDIAVNVSEGTGSYHAVIASDRRERGNLKPGFETKL
jgi:hypothetical protein